MQQVILNILLIVLFIYVGNFVLKLYASSKYNKLMKENKDLVDTINNIYIEHNKNAKVAKKVALILSIISLDKILEAMYSYYKEEELDLHIKELIEIMESNNE